MDIGRAKRIQEKLALGVRLDPLREKVRFVVGVDAAFSATRVYAAAALYSFPGLELIEESVAVSKIRFPYAPGYLSFREAPALIQAVRRLKSEPGLILVDGQGIAHPRGIGMASHVGVLLNIPAVGCAKSRLIGEFAEPDGSKGCWSPLVHQGKIVGAVMRTRDNVRPLFVSPGHRVNLRDCLIIVAACLKGYRIPEPLRRADYLSKKELRRSLADEP